MNVSSYVFQSPYPSQIQIGRPNPTAQKEEAPQQQEMGSNVTNPTAQEAEQYLQSVTTSPAASVNVAESSVDTGVSSSMDGFTTVNAQVQASEAYTG